MAGTLKTVIVLAGPTGPTGTMKGVNIWTGMSGLSGGHATWLQYTGGKGPSGILERVYPLAADGAGFTGAHKTVFISGYVGPTGS